MPPRARILSALALTLLAAWGLLAQPASPDPTPSFGDRVEVSVISLEVFVTDRDGKPIRGLKQEDFELTEGGKPVEISNFSAFEGGSATEILAGEASLEGGVEPPAPPPPPPLSLILYVDNVHLLPATRKRAFTQVKEFLTQSVPKGARFSIVSYERSPRLALDFTQDLSAVFATLDDLAKKNPMGIEGRAGRQIALSQIRAAYDDQGCDERAVDQMRVAALSYAQPLAADDAQSYRALGEFVSTLAGIEGRKALLHLSDGVPLLSGEEVFSLTNSLCEGTFERLDLSRFAHYNSLRNVTRQANAGGVTFYTLEAAGVRAPISSSADQAQGTLYGHQELEAIANQQDALYNLADATGGKAILNTNKLAAALVEVTEDLENYYWLGFTTERAADGRARTLDIKVRRDGVKVRYRKTFREKSREEKHEERVLGALLFGKQDNPLGAVLEKGPIVPTSGKDAKKGVMLVPVRLRLPMANLALLSQEGGGGYGKLRISMMARDHEGGTAPMRKVEVPIELSKEQLGESGGKSFAYEIKIAMRAGEHRLALGVEDVPTGVTSYVAFDFTVPKG